ncbi:sugar phosphate nucleotidyltransferase [Chloroflexota bacterium]
MDTQIAILAGGLATRLGDLTRDKAKSMVEIQGRPFLEYQLEMLNRSDIINVVLCLGHAGEQIMNRFGNGREYESNIIYSFENKQLGTAGALKNAKDLLDDIFFTMYGDSYIFLDFAEVLSYFKSQNKMALMTVYKNFDQYGTSNTAIEGDLVKRYSKKEKTRDMVYIEYGVNILKKEVLGMVPDDRFYSLGDLFIQLIEMKELLAFEVKERFFEIGSLQGLREFEEYIGGAG